jgi:hypothetical protein
VDFMPTLELAKRANVMPKFGPKAVPGIFLGYFLNVFIIIMACLFQKCIFFFL